ncbi:hypothetical protein [Atlantibacter subterraneus]|uniref:hypothetical protein n=1 Tax=Atlantibacter subterraneus TaxID=255519 RepID=UPI0028AFDEFB|nr:hypothetical protein [Atlantibacter subterranea]
MEFSKAAAELVDEYRRAPRAEPLDFTRTAAYRQFIEAAEQEDFTSAEIEMDTDYAERRPEWVANADEGALRQWVHTLIRSDRWNADYPTAIMDACRSGSIGELVARLNGAAGAFHAGR